MKTTLKRRSHRSHSARSARLALDPGKGVVLVDPENAELTFAQVMAPVIPGASEAGARAHSARERSVRPPSIDARASLEALWGALSLRQRLWLVVHRHALGSSSTSIERAALARRALSTTASSSPRRHASAGPLWTRFTPRGRHSSAPSPCSDSPRALLLARVRRALLPRDRGSPRRPRRDRRYTLDARAQSGENTPAFERSPPPRSGGPRRSRSEALSRAAPREPSRARCQTAPWRDHVPYGP